MVRFMASAACTTAGITDGNSSSGESANRSDAWSGVRSGCSDSASGIESVTATGTGTSAAATNQGLAAFSKVFFLFGRFSDGIAFASMAVSFRSGYPISFGLWNKHLALLRRHYS